MTRPDWMTDDMIRAEAALEEARYALAATVERAIETADRAIAESPPLTDEEVDAFRDMCLDSPAWQDVARRVERGELTWREIAEGEATGDPGVAAAVRGAIQLAKEPAAQGTAGRRAPDEEESFEDDIDSALPGWGSG